MSTTIEVPELKTEIKRSGGLGATLRRNGWVLGLVGILAALLVVAKLINPNYGPAGIQGLAISVLPLAFAAVAQAIAVIARGIDLSVGSMMALTSVVAATLMDERSEGFAVAVVIGVILLGFVLGVINGSLIVITRVPDIVVTLAMLFVWAGAALLVLNTPGGGSAEWLRELTLGPFFNEWIPKAAVVLFVVVAVIWVPIKRSRLGLSLYAIGSDPLAAYRSGVSVNRTKILAYGLTGLFSAIAGLSLTASTGIGTPVPGPYTLMSVAAVVLGGVSLAGGVGGIFGPIIAVVILSLLRAIMTFMGVDTNLATVAQGLILVGVVMVSSLLQLRRRER
ncbi:MAG TPA: ABC transporter permease [Acidimicrobiia bacterium]